MPRIFFGDCCFFGRLLFENIAEQECEQNFFRLASDSFTPVFGRIGLWHFLQI
jgi:hypothetical protein